MSLPYRSSTATATPSQCLASSSCPSLRRREPARAGERRAAESGREALARCCEPGRIPIQCRQLAEAHMPELSIRFAFSRTSVEDFLFPDSSLERPSEPGDAEHSVPSANEVSSPMTRPLRILPGEACHFGQSRRISSEAHPNLSRRGVSDVGQRSSVQRPQAPWFGGNSVYFRGGAPCCGFAQRPADSARNRLLCRTAACWFAPGLSYCAQRTVTLASSGRLAEESPALIV